MDRAIRIFFRQAPEGKIVRVKSTAADSARPETTKSNFKLKMKGLKAY